MWATSRSASRGFLLPPKQLEAFPDTAIPGGSVIKAAYTSDGRGIVAWSGRNAVRAAFVNGRSIGAPQDLAPIPSSPDDLANIGLENLVVGANGAAAVTMVAAVDAQNDNQVLAAPLAGGAAAFGPAEVVSGAGSVPRQPERRVRPGHQPARRGLARLPGRRHEQRPGRDAPLALTVRGQTPQHCFWL